MLIEIKHRYTGAVLFSHDVEGNTVEITLLAGIASGSDLSGSNLRGSNLSGSNLRGSNLSGCNLSGCNLSGSNLSGCNLSGSNLSGSNLSGEIIEKTPLFINGLHWPITITTKHLTVGCQHHSHEEWADFDDQAIADMDSHAKEFWSLWKWPLLVMCAAHKL